MHMKDWMRALADQYERTRCRYPDDRLLILFDIDGTILDMRHMVQYVLLSFDRTHGSSFFKGLRIDNIKVHENHVDEFLDTLPLPGSERRDILDWYQENRWNSDAILASHQPYRGVMDVIRWFQIQPATSVGLNTGRPEGLREDTLRSLNALGREYRVEFQSNLLFMNPRGWEDGVAEAKREGLRYFQEAGYRLFAAVDNEPRNIEAMIKGDPEGEILFLHANTLFESKRSATPRTVRGDSYDIASLVSERDLPNRIQFVWHGINDRANLRQFLASAIHWGECDVRRDPMDRVVLRHDSFAQTPWSADEEWLELDKCLEIINQHGRGIKLDLKEGDELVRRVLDIIEQSRLDGSRLWFNGTIQSLQEEGFRRIRETYPDAIVQSPVDFLAPMILAVPEKAQEVLGMMTSWGINRFSVSWRTERKRHIFDCLDRWGYEVNFYDVPDLESYLQAALLLPTSLTSDFNFPRWHYFGRGSGEGREHHEYRLHPNRNGQPLVPST